MTLGRRPPRPDREQRLEERAQRAFASQMAMKLEAAGLRPRVTMGGSTSGKPVPKENVIDRHAGYENAVRGLGYCMLCGRRCRPQFCHADQGKGIGIKTDVRLGWPGCGPSEEYGPGCHYLVGTSGHYPKDRRRVLERWLARKTQRAVKRAGTWPKGLPMLPTKTPTPAGHDAGN